MYVGLRFVTWSETLNRGCISWAFDDRDRNRDHCLCSASSEMRNYEVSECLGHSIHVLASSHAYAFIPCL